MRIKIFGDSFAVDKEGWISFLKYPCDVYSNRGSSQYRIYKNFIKHYDESTVNIIVCTHYSRVYVKDSVITKLRQLITHQKSDWVWTHGIASKDPLTKNIKLIYDDEYQKDIFKLMCNHIKSFKNTYTLSAWNDCVQPDFCFADIWKEHQGKINHLTMNGNKILAEKINELF